MADTLLDLTGEYLELYEMLSDTDVDEQVVKDTLEAITGEIEIKADGYAVVIDRLMGEAAIRSKMADKLISSAKALENHATRMKDRLKYCMEQMNVKELKGKYFTYKISGNGGKQPLKYVEGVEIPQSYMKVIVDVDNDKVRKTLEAGESLPFAYLEERGTHLRIK